MKPKKKVEEQGIDVSATNPMPAAGVCTAICRVLECGGSVVSIASAGFSPKPGVILANQPPGAIDLYRIFWMAPHAEPPRMPGNGELRIKQE